MLLAIVLQLSVVFCESLAQETAPFVEFFDTRLLNNSWLGINTLSNVSGPSCVTDLATCCPTEQSMASREWVLPNGTRLTQDGVQEIGSLGVSTGAHKFELVLTDSKAAMNGGLDGMYECVIDTGSGPRQSFFIGLYDPPHGGYNSHTPVKITSFISTCTSLISVLYVF